MIGASANSSGSAARGRSSSLNISLMTSASGCSSPCQPTRVGPSRCCSSAATLRSTYTIAAAELSSATKTNSVRTICATSSGRHGLMRSHRVPRPPRRGQRAAPFLDVRLVLVPEMLQRRQHRRDRGVAERAQRLAGDVARDAREQIEIAASALRRARCAAGSCAASRCLRGRACTCRTTRGGRSAAGSRPATPCRWCRRARRSPPSRAASRPSGRRRSSPGMSS